jgi:3-oxoacyl-[acyl-carrier protein] reductase
MLLQNKNAIIYGAGGAIGRVVAKAFAREGARLFLTGDHAKPIDELTREIGSAASAATVDALDERAVEAHADDVVGKAGSIDISFNLVSIPHEHGTALVDLGPDDFVQPIRQYAQTHFVTATAAARRMIPRRSGVVLMMTASPARMSTPFVGAFGAVCALVEAFAHTLAAEAGPSNVRVACLLSSGSPEAPGVEIAFGAHAKAHGITQDEFHAAQERRALLRRLTTLDEVGRVAAVIASDRASAITGTTVNLSCGAIVD